MVVEPDPLLDACPGLGHSVVDITAIYAHLIPKDGEHYDEDWRVMMKSVVFTFFIFFIGCSHTPTQPKEKTPSLEIYSQLPMDQNGFYHFQYSGLNYLPVEYTTQPLTRVYCSSPDSFSVVFQNQVITSPIVDYSTYSDEDGNGNQMVYVSEAMVGDTLSIYGYTGDVRSDNITILIL